MTPPANRLTPTAWVLLIALGTLWGTAFPIGSVLLRELPPVTLGFLRLAIGAASLLVLLPLLGYRLQRRRLPDYALMGLFNNVIPFSLMFWGQARIGAGLTAVLIALTPMLTLIINQFATSDARAGPGVLTGLSLGFAGVASIVGLDALAGIGDRVLADLACVGAAFSYAVSALVARRFRGEPVTTTSAGQLSMAAVIFLPIALLLDRPWQLPLPDPRSWGLLLVFAIPGMALTYLIFHRIVAIAGAVNVMLVTFITPVVAVAVAAIILGEQMQPHHWVGMALIALGLGAIDGRPTDLLARLLRRSVL